jgi:hypothetical protein
MQYTAILLIAIIFLGCAESAHVRLKPADKHSAMSIQIPKDNRIQMYSSR